MKEAVEGQLAPVRYKIDADTPVEKIISLLSSLIEVCLSRLNLSRVILRYHEVLLSSIYVHFLYSRRPYHQKHALHSCIDSQLFTFACLKKLVVKTSLYIMYLSMHTTVNPYTYILAYCFKIFAKIW